MKKALKKFLKGTIRVLIYIFLILFFRVKIEGKENLPSTGAYIICGNHRSNWDPVFLVVFTKREMQFMAKKELFKNKFVNFLAYVCDVFPVDRENKDITAMKKSLKVLESGECLGLFPEGTRNGLEKNGKAQNGAAYFSLRTGTKIVPVGISGNFKLFSKVTLKYGEPLDFSEYGSKKPDKEVLNKVSEEIMNSIISLTK